MSEKKKKSTLAIGNEYKISVVDMSTEGWGIGKLGHLTVFLNEGISTITGDDVTVLITKLAPRFAYGKVIKVGSYSSKRRKPQCLYSEECGGCALQSMNYKSQLILKRKLVQSALQRIGKIDSPPVKPTIGMSKPLRYRNKAQFPVGRPNLIGFYRLKSHEVVDCASCTIQTLAAEKVAETMRQYIQKENISVYDPVAGVGLLRHVVVRVGMITGEVMVILVVNNETPPYFRGLAQELEQALDRLKEFTVESEGEEVQTRWRLKSLVVNLNRWNTSLILGDKCVTIYGEDRIVDVSDGLLFEISPHSFFQVNPVQMKLLYDTAIRYANLTGKETVADVYCGVGSIGMHLAHHAKRVIGIESEAAAVADARRNAALNGISNMEFICDRAEFALPGLKKKGIDIHTLILDPPSSGCDSRLLKGAADAKPHRIVYVSCNPATLARDVKILQELDYELQEVQPIDMFPQTMHIECAAWLSYKGELPVIADEPSEPLVQAEKVTPNQNKPPGRVLEELMQNQGISLKTLSIRTGVTMKRVQDIINGAKEISPAYAKLLGEVFGETAPAKFWNSLK